MCRRLGNAKRTKTFRTETRKQGIRRSVIEKHEYVGA